MGRNFTEVKHFFLNGHDYLHSSTMCEQKLIHIDLLLDEPRRKCRAVIVGTVYIRRRSLCNKARRGRRLPVFVSSKTDHPVLGFLDVVVIVLH